MLVNILFGLTVILSYFPAVNGLCSYPCSRINKGTFTDGINTWEYSCQNTSVLTFNGQKQIECYERHGAFLAVRLGNEYRCIKQAMFNHRKGIAFFYSSPFKIFHENPSICDVCTGEFQKDLYVAKGVNLETAKRFQHPPLGCNLPPLCPHVNKTDIPCTGCEWKEDDGFQCSGCNTSSGYCCTPEPVFPDCFSDSSCQCLLYIGKRKNN